MQINQILTDAARQLFTDAVTPAHVRAIEGGEETAALWQAFEDAGFPDALVPEEQGGSGLALADVHGLLEACGEFVVPLPLADTVLARGLLSLQGRNVPAGSTVFGVGRLGADGSLRCSLVRFGRVAGHVLVHDGAMLRVLAVADAVRKPAAFCLDAALEWPADVVGKADAFEPHDTQDSVLDDAPLLLAALSACVQLGGALQAVFNRTLQYANDRQQFGRPIGKFQAIQHQLAVMSEHVFAARMASQLAVSAGRVLPDANRVAIGKASTGEAAVAVAALSHSIHGAIGFTEEYDLQLYTRRLHQWRQTGGTESFWHERLGSAAICGDSGSALDFLRAATDPVAVGAN